MEIEVTLVGILNHLNKIGSKVFIERVDNITGIIFLSNKAECNIAHLAEPADIENYID